jgi:hypothetical protein
VPQCFRTADQRPTQDFPQRLALSSTSIGLGNLDLLQFGLLIICTSNNLDFCNAIFLCCYRL